MSIYSDNYREIIYHLLELLPTIEEALQHMQTQLNELRLEESAALFKDTADAIGSIGNYLPSLLEHGDKKDLLQKTAVMREGIAMTINAFESANLLAIQMAVTHSLLPAFSAWRQELVQILRPELLS